MTETADTPVPPITPRWATGPATSPFQLGAQLCTKDGRRTGNGVIVHVETMVFPGGIEKPLYHVVTDAGNAILCMAEAIERIFHPAMWVMDPSKAPGVVLLALKGGLDLRWGLSPSMDISKENPHEPSL